VDRFHPPQSDLASPQLQSPRSLWSMPDACS
jgi:hypothetical protein